MATVSSEALVKAPTASVEQSLQGKLAGAMITQNSGAPGGGDVVRLRPSLDWLGALSGRKLLPATEMRAGGGRKVPA